MTVFEMKRKMEKATKNKPTCELIPFGFILKTKRGPSNRWTFEEFSKIQKGFKEGRRIKILAQEIGRSETAVNKFLSRSGIRKISRRRHKKPKLFVNKNHIKNHVTQVCSCSNRKSFTDVLTYLIEKGYTIRKNQSFGRTFYKAEEYLLNEKPASKMKILLCANKLRSEENKEIFGSADVL